MRGSVGNVSVGIIANTDKFESGFRRAANTTRKRSRQMQKDLGGITTAMQRLGSVVGMSIAIKSYIDLADQAKSLRARLGIVEKSQDGVNASMNRLYKIAQQTRAPLAATATLYTRLATIVDRTKFSSDDLMKVTKAMNVTLIASGATAKETNSSIMQFAQAMGSGKLAGDEFRAISESNIFFLKILAKGLGVATGALKGMSAAGKLTTETTLKGLLKGMGDLDNLMGKIPETVSGAMINLQSSFLKMVNDFESTKHASDGLVTSLEFLNKNLGLLATIGFHTAAAAAIIYGAKLSGLGAVKVKSLIGAKALLEAELAQARAATIAATQAVSEDAALVKLATTKTAVAAANARLATSEKILAGAMQLEASAAAEAAAATGTLGVAIKGTLAFIGGIPGLIALSTYGFYKMGEAMRANSVDAINLTVKIANLKKAIEQEKKNPNQSLGQLKFYEEQLKRAVKQLHELEKGNNKAKGSQDKLDVSIDLFGRHLAELTAHHRQNLRATLSNAEANKVLNAQRRKGLQVIANLRSEQQKLTDKYLEEGDAIISTLAPDSVKKASLKKLERQYLKNLAAINKVVVAEKVFSLGGVGDFRKAERDSIAKLNALHTSSISKRMIEEKSLSKYKKLLLSDDLKAQNAHAEKVKAIRNNFANSVSSGITDILNYEIWAKKKATKSIKEELATRLEDINTQLKDGTISIDEANKLRLKAQQKFTDDLAKINKSIGEQLKTVLVGSFKSALEDMFQAWLTSGIKGILTGDGFSGFTGGSIIGDLIGGKGSGGIAGIGASGIAGIGASGASGAAIDAGAASFVAPASVAGAASFVAPAIAAVAGYKVLTGLFGHKNRPDPRTPAQRLADQAKERERIRLKNIEGGHGFARGTAYVPHDMTARIHQGEIIIKRQDSDILRKYGVKSDSKGVIDAIDRNTAAIVSAIDTQTRNTALFAEAAA